MTLLASVFLSAYLCQVSYHKVTPTGIRPALIVRELCRTGVNPDLVGE